MFFGVEWVSALVRISFQIVFALVTGVPFWISWNAVASKYLYFIPQMYHKIPYWHIVSIILVCKFVGELLSHLVPTLINVSQTNE